MHHAPPHPHLLVRRLLGALLRQLTSLYRQADDDRWRGVYIRLPVAGAIVRELEQKMRTRFFLSSAKYSVSTETCRREDT